MGKSSCLVNFTLHSQQLPTQETAGNGNGKETEAHTCPVHGVDMKRYEKDGRSWYAHRSDGGSWCNGKKKN
jgi:hypothetical protein